MAAASSDKPHHRMMASNHSPEVESCPRGRVWCLPLVMWPQTHCCCSLQICLVTAALQHTTESWAELSQSVQSATAAAASVQCSQSCCRGRAQCRRRSCCQLPPSCPPRCSHSCCMQTPRHRRYNKFLPSHELHQLQADEDVTMRLFTLHSINEPEWIITDRKVSYIQMICLAAAKI